MTTGAVTPDEATFRQLARDYRVIPVTRRLLADGETPVGVYRKLAGGPGSFLLESAEQGIASGGSPWSRYSFIGVRSAATLITKNGETTWLGSPPSGIPRSGNPIDVLRGTVAALSAPGQPQTGEDLPPLTGGLVGFMGYDVVRHFEKLPELTEDDLQIPDIGMMLATDLVVLDHFTGSALLVANVIIDPSDGDGDGAIVAGYHQAIGRLDAMTTALARPTPPLVSTVELRPVGTPYSRTPDGAHQKAVEEAKEAIRAGECFQIVVAQRFARPTNADPLDIYRVLRMSNPSPYMYLLRFDDFDVVGSSPEVHVKVTNGRALLHPIAGTRWRGATTEEDNALAAELLADPKERAEHVMLVDLGRNDLGRVSVPGSVEVPEFATIERFSHVMHIVSTVVGELAPQYTPFDALVATFPAGTVSGAPKVRAMEIIEELEPTRRGLYGGIVGYFGFGGDMDTAIAIRTALIRDGVAYVQAGGGIVADSDPDAEHQETINKAAAVLAAIATAETLRPAR